MNLTNYLLIFSQNISWFILYPHLYYFLLSIFQVLTHFFKYIIIFNCFSSTIMLLRSIKPLVSLWKFMPAFSFLQPIKATSKLTALKEFKPITINSLADNPGSRRVPKKLGRGPGSGKGKTAGRGHKGHKARSGGGVSHRFEGGQSPIHRRLPKFGGRKINKEQLDYVNVETLIYYIKRGVLEADKPITIKTLADCGIVKKVKYGVKILARGISDLNLPLQLQVTDASKSVIDKINSLGGRVTCVYRTPLLIKKCLKPEDYKHVVEEPLPQKRRVKQLDRIQERGATVVYNKPDWKKKFDEEHSIGQSVPKRKYPIERYPGMGAGVIRKRKQKIPKVINYNLP